MQKSKTKNTIARRRSMDAADSLRIGLPSDRISAARVGLPAITEATDRNHLHVSRFRSVLALLTIEFL
jgi:hypothetical protein